MIEPYLSEQWFVKIQPLADAGDRAVEDGTVRFAPESWAKTYFALDAQHPRLVHLAAALVGAPDSRLHLRRTAT